MSGEPWPLSPRPALTVMAGAVPGAAVAPLPATSDSWGGAPQPHLCSRGAACLPSSAGGGWHARVAVGVRRLLWQACTTPPDTRLSLYPQGRWARPVRGLGGQWPSFGEPACGAAHLEIPAGEQVPPQWRPKPAVISSASRSWPGCPVAGSELAPAWKVAFLPGSVSMCRGGRTPRRGQARAPGPGRHRASGQPVRPR